MRVRKGASGPSSSAQRTYGGDFTNLIPHDYTLAPKTNDRIAKLGSGAGTRLVSIADYDDEAKEILFNDGQAHRVSSLARLEPDNWAHINRGNGDKTWELRHVVDHENPATSPKHRSTMGVNQKGKMCWSYDQDLEWIGEIKEVGPPIPPGRNFNGAGFLESLYGKIKKTTGFKKPGQSGATFIFPKVAMGPAERVNVITASNQASKPMRGTRCLNVNMRGGYITDGRWVAQLRQLFFMVPFNKPKPRKDPPHLIDQETPSNQADTRSNTGQGGGYASRRGLRGVGRYGNPGQLDQPPEKTEGQRQNELIDRDRADRAETTAMEKSGGRDGGCMFDRQMAALRGDVLFDVLGKASALAYEDVKPARGDDAYYGAFFLGLPSSWGPKYVPAEDVSSDQPILETPNAERGIRPFVYIPKQNHRPPGCQVEPHFDPITPAYGTTGVIPPAHTGSGADAGEWLPPLTLVDREMTVHDFQPGKLTSVPGSIPIPVTSGDLRYEIYVPYVLPVVLAAGKSMTFRLFYKVVLGPGQIAGEQWTELTKVITPGDNPTTPHQVQYLCFDLPGLGLGRTGLMGGGTIYYRFMRRSDDNSGGKHFHLVGNLQFSHSPVNSRRQPYAGVR